MPLAFSQAAFRFWPLILTFSGQASVRDLQRIILVASVGGCSVCLSVMPVQISTQ